MDSVHDLSLAVGGGSIVLTPGGHFLVTPYRLRFAKMMDKLETLTNYVLGVANESQIGLGLCSAGDKYMLLWKSLDGGQHKNP